MKKLLILTLCFLSVSMTCLSQIKVASNGYVGIGVSNPTLTKLQINGSVYLTENNSFWINSNNDSGNRLRLHHNTNAYIDYEPDLIFRSGNYNQSTFSQKVVFASNGQVAIGGNTYQSYTLTVWGSAYCNSQWTASDLRFKKNIKSINGALNKVLKMNGKSYEFNKEEFSERNFEEGYSLGFIAQELKEIIPEAVRTDSLGYHCINYNEIIPVLVEAIKEQQNTIKELGFRIEIMENDCCSSLKNAELGTNSFENSNIEEAVLYQNTPNPFKEQTDISCFIPENSIETLIGIYDLNGIQLDQFRINGTGKKSITIKGSKFNPGMYLYSLIIDGREIDTKRMILTK